MRRVTILGMMSLLLVAAFGLANPIITFRGLTLENVQLSRDGGVHLVPGDGRLHCSTEPTKKGEFKLRVEGAGFLRCEEDGRVVFTNKMSEATAWVTGGRSAGVRKDINTKEEKGRIITSTTELLSPAGRPLGFADGKLVASRIVKAPIKVTEVVTELDWYSGK